MAAKTLTIDGKQISAEEGATILQAAEEAGVKIPTLCHLDGVYDVGACRLCLVEVTGVPKLLPACTTKVAEGMDIKTDSERLRKYRRMTLELLFAERNHVCAVCVANGHCELQTLAYWQGMDHVRYEYTFPKWSVDNTHPLFGMDHNRCILCTRCVRVCWHIEGAGTKTSPVAGARPTSSPTSTSRGANPFPAPVAASASWVARPARCFTRVRRWPKWSATAPSLNSSFTAREKKQWITLKVATTWFGGCSGCHMSFLDLDEFLIELAGAVDLVYSPVVDVKEYPENVDVCLIEGAVCNEDNLEILHKIRARTKVLVSFGDCAVTGNVPAIRNQLGLDNAENVLQRAYIENADINQRMPKADGIVPQLLERVLPVHEVVHVELFSARLPAARRPHQGADVAGARRRNSASIRQGHQIWMTATRHDFSTTQHRICQNE